MKQFYSILRKSFCVILLSWVCILPAAEEAKPLGFTLGKTTLEEFKAKYPKHEEIGFGVYTKGPTYKVFPQLLPLDHVEKAKFFFNYKNKLVLVLLEFEGRRFDRLKSTLSERYKLIKEEGMNVPVLGNVGQQSAEYHQGNVKISLSLENNRSMCELKYSMIKDPDHQRDLIFEEQKKLL